MAHRQGALFHEDSRLIPQCSCSTLGMTNVISKSARCRIGSNLRALPHDWRGKPPRTAAGQPGFPSSRQVRKAIFAQILLDNCARPSSPNLVSNPCLFCAANRVEPGLPGPNGVWSIDTQQLEFIQKELRCPK